MKRKKFYVPAVLFALCSAGASAFATTGAGEAAKGVQSAISSSTPVAIAFMISILIMKVTAFILGYFIVKLGHDTLVRGISGDINFGFSGSGVKLKLKSASPGGFFVLMGSAIIMWSIFVQKPMEIVYKPEVKTVISSSQDTGVTSEKPGIPVPD